MAKTFSCDVNHAYDETVMDQHFYSASIFRFIQVREFRIIGNLTVFR